MNGREERSEGEIKEIIVPNWYQYDHEIRNYVAESRTL